MYFRHLDSHLSFEGSMKSLLKSPLRKWFAAKLNTLDSKKTALHMGIDLPQMLCRTLLTYWVLSFCSLGIVSPTPVPI